MAIPNIDTFEHDISEEIKHKEATIGDIAASGGEIGNTPVRSSSLSLFLVGLGILFVAAVIATSIILFLKYRGDAPAVTPAATGVEVPRGTAVSSLSASIDSAVGSSIGTIQASEYGYIAELKSYSDVFAYMLRNEDTFADELAAAVGSSRDTSTTSLPFIWTDVTINNQNMRVGTSGTNTVVYAFVNTKHLLISKTTEGILALRGAILR